MKKSLNKKTFYLSMSILVLVTIITGTTTAVKNYKNEIILSTNDSYYTSYLQVNNNASEENSIDIKSFPLEDFEALEKVKSQTFTITNTGNLSYVFDIQFLPSNDEGINSKYIKIQINNSSPITLNDLNKNNTKNNLSNSLKEYSLLPGESLEIIVKIWLDINTPNDQIGKSINLSLVTNGYADNIYNDTSESKLDGEGTKDNPYLIASIEDLMLFSNDVNQGNTYKNKYVKLATTLDFNNPSSYTSINCKNNDYNIFTDTCKQIKEFESIGKDNNSFQGIFDGDNHYIKNIPYINNYSLFDNIDNAVITNIKLSGTYKITNNEKIELGSIVKYSKNSDINNCYNRNNYNLTSKENITFGGIVSISENSNIKNNYNYGNIYINDSDLSNLGGIVGLSDNNSIIENNYNYGYLSNNANESYTGGIIAKGKVSNSINYGIVISNSNINYLGGISGYLTNKSNNLSNYGLITDGNYQDNSYQKSNSVKTYIGGITGYNEDTITNSANYNNLRNTSNEGTYIGGISGLSKNNLDKTNNTGNIISATNNTNNYVGGIVGLLDENSKISNSINIGNINSITGIIGGIAGKINNNCIITTTYNTGNLIINGNNKNLDLGGITGVTEDYSLITTSYNSGAIDITKINSLNLGGIVGNTNSDTSINYTYNTGKIKYTEVSSGTVGGIIGTGINTNILYNYSITSIKDNKNLNTGAGIGYLDNKDNYKTKVFALTNNSKKIGPDNIDLNNNYLITKTYIKSNEFLKILNKEENKWLQNNNINNGYPYLKDIETKSQS